MLGPQGREFKQVFNGAQETLRGIFGMEMIELPAKDRKLLTMEQKRKGGFSLVAVCSAASATNTLAVSSLAAAKSQSQREAASNAYVLVSVLPDNFRTAAILTPSKVQSPDGEAAYAALYTFIISIIVISGGELSDPRLRRHLTRLNAAENMPSLNPNNPNTPSEKTELVLQRMIKQGYLIRTTDTSGHGDEDTTTWHVGPRGKVEVDNEAIAKLVREVYGESNPDLENRIQASLKLRDQMTDAQGAVEEQEAERDEGMGNGGPGPGTRRRSARRAGNYDDEEE